MMQRRRLFLVYPLLGAAYPLLALFAANAGERVPASDLLLPLGLTVTVTSLAWLITRLLTRDPHRQAICALLWGVWFNCYGQLVAIGEGLSPFAFFGDDRLLLPASMGVVAICCRAILRSGSAFDQASKSLNLLSCGLLVIPALTYISAADRASSASARAPARWDAAPLPSTPSDQSPRRRPDVYYILLDAYTGSRSLQSNYQFDNREFEDFLRARGFFVPRESRSNYANTFLALAAALNWQYLDWLTEELGPRSRDRGLPYAMVEDSRVMRFLKAQGYRFVFFPTPFGATAHNRYADEVLPGGSRSPEDSQSPPPSFHAFAAVWLTGTPGRPLIEWTCALLDCSGDGLPFVPEAPELFRWKFDQIGRLARQPGPKFVFAHLLLPHEPYVFRSDCSTKPLRWPRRIDEAEDRRLRVEYVDQVRCVNTQVAALVERLLRDSPQPPVIILQADHGNGRFVFGRPPAITEISKEQLTERTDIFAAYYLPEGGDAELYDSISPVNVFPTVLRHYFRVTLPRLEDRSYYSAWASPYRFTRLP
jgi:hypothetical protein